MTSFPDEVLSAFFPSRLDLDEKFRPRFGDGSVPLDVQPEVPDIHGDLFHGSKYLGVRLAKLGLSDAHGRRVGRHAQELVEVTHVQVVGVCLHEHLDGLGLDAVRDLHERGHDELSSLFFGLYDSRLVPAHPVATRASQRVATKNRQFTVTSLSSGTRIRTEFCRVAR